MPFVPFHDLCPDVAEEETRTITVMPHSNLGVPPAHYGFVELFCDEEDCDCRRVMFMVMSSTQEPQAVIALGWEEVEFYYRWLGMDDKAAAAEMRGPALNVGSPQSQNAQKLLELAQRVLLSDPAYVDRVKRHYAMFRAKVDEGHKPKKKTSKEAARERRREWKSCR